MKTLLSITAALTVLLFAGCTPDPDITTPTVPVAPDCRAEALNLDPSRLPSQVLITDAAGEMIRSVVLTYDENERVVEKSFLNGDLFTYNYGDAFNRIPDRVVESRADEPDRLIVYRFSEDCLPLREQNLLNSSVTSPRIVLGEALLTHQGRRVATATGSPFVGIEAAGSVYFRNPSTGLVDSIITRSINESPERISVEKEYFTYSDVDNPYPIPEAMRYEGLASTFAEHAPKMLATYRRTVASAIFNSDSTTTYEYELDGEGRIRAINYSDGRRVVYLY